MIPETPPQTLTERIIARAAGIYAVRPGDEVWVTPDRMIMNDSSGPRRLATLVEELGGLWDPSRVVVVSDHFVPAANLRHAEIVKTTRRWSKEQQVYFFEYQGILHNLVIQEGLVEPGMLLVGADSHTTSAGAVGAVAVPIGSTELATVLASGKVWLRVPETIRIDLTGNLPPYCDIRDVTMHILRDLGMSDASYRAIEYGGVFAEELGWEDRLVLANQGAEMGAKNAVVVPGPGLSQDLDETALIKWCEPDPDANYEKRLSYDVSHLEPLVAQHPAPDQVGAAEDFNAAVDMAWIGSCAGGRYTDLRAAAQVLDGKQATIPLLVTPATKAIYDRAMADGTLQILSEAGATIMPPGCGACAGIHAGVQGDGDRVIATATRNFPGRMGSREAEIYLGSAATVAASAVTGKVTNPKEEVS